MFLLSCKSFMSINTWCLIGMDMVLSHCSFMVVMSKVGVVTLHV